MRVVMDRRDPVLVVRLTRPEKRNAIDAATSAGLSAALDLLEDDDALLAGVLTGEGQVFCAGTDLLAGAGEPSERGGAYGVVRRSATKPLIAAVEGLALGGGMEIVLACDLVVAGRSAAFGLPEVARGLVAECGALFRGPRALPLNVARELLLTGDRLSAERAERLGFVNVLVDDGSAVEEAVGLAQRICDNGPVAVRATLQALHDVCAGANDLGWAATEVARAAARTSADAEEGRRAFAERRAPQWTGR